MLEIPSIQGEAEEEATTKERDTGEGNTICYVSFTLSR